MNGDDSFLSTYVLLSAPLFSPQGLYIFLVYAVYNSEVKMHSVQFLSCKMRAHPCALCEAASLLDKSVGVKTASHLGEECHKEDQRKEKGLIFHGEWAEGSIRTENKSLFRKVDWNMDWIVMFWQNCSQPTSFLPSQRTPITSWGHSLPTTSSPETSETSVPAGTTSTSMVIKNGELTWCAPRSNITHFVKNTDWSCFTITLTSVPVCHNRLIVGLWLIKNQS